MTLSTKIRSSSSFYNYNIIGVFNSQVTTVTCSSSGGNEVLTYKSLDLHHDTLTIFHWKVDLELGNNGRLKLKIGTSTMAEIIDLTAHSWPRWSEEEEEEVE